MGVTLNKTRLVDLRVRAYRAEHPDATPHEARAAVLRLFWQPAQQYMVDNPGTSLEAAFTAVELAQGLQLVGVTPESGVSGGVVWRRVEA